MIANVADTEPRTDENLFPDFPNLAAKGNVLSFKSVFRPPTRKIGDLSSVRTSLC